MDAAKEIIGSVARWSLLAVAGGLVLVTTVLAVGAGASAVEVDEPTRWTFSDAVWLYDGPVYAPARGIVSPPIGLDKEEPVLCAVPGREPWLTRMNDQGLLVQAGKMPAGRYVVSVMGLPHSRNTFATSELMLSVPRRRSVLLVSTRNYLTFGRYDSRVGVFQLFESFRRVAEPIAIHGGDAESFLLMDRDRRFLRKITELAYVDIQWPIRKAALRAFLRRCGMTQEGVSVSLLTWDASLAEMAAKLGVDSHLILPADTPDSAPAGVHVYSSLEKFNDYLNGLPISD
jgi:hypothetical protein